ncbi:ABC transporter ATP-binding protein [Chelatococcus asaccharovorans]|uniref:Branched-chain amino acid transport system ATP-binding protein n=1 Tax=Chelatococcus asaccharovorans TaxID=28210 RepID=A0A2V3UII5_9HYPH|nr:ABC transporter ATP-binding protein [Chelatococcus asaccharovorans]MBS7706372.1 ABC transporter ATP-binding protein [Chelatococcus asaccharovorans]PXW64986.1 branched-chain amino acid transport system ATP-binding protein [Chelatococcus asaccharovorans]
MLELSGLSVTYGKVRAVEDIALTAARGEAVALIGANGAGKSSILKAILGLATSSGSVRVDGTELTGRPSHARVMRGVALSPEGRHVFPQMSVLENLEMGFIGGDFPALCEDMLELFPRLRERSSQLAGSMSGGEQQMLAIARALMSRPKVLMLDEPTLGLAPIIVDQIRALIGLLKTKGMTVLLAEQNAEMALAATDRAYVLETGHITATGPSAKLAADPAIRRAYLGL